MSAKDYAKNLVKPPRTILTINKQNSFASENILSKWTNPSSLMAEQFYNKAHQLINQSNCEKEQLIWLMALVLMLILALILATSCGIKSGLTF
jgi:hypothetical protein